MSTPPDLGPLPRPFVPGDEHNPRDYFIADQMRAERQRCYMLGVAAERERCIAWVRYWLTGTAPAMATHEARCLVSLKGNGYAPLPSAPTKEGG